MTQADDVRRAAEQAVAELVADALAINGAHIQQETSGFDLSVNVIARRLLWVFIVLPSFIYPWISLVG